jgi:O-antigen/teichoic acid export membrane protein
MAAMDNIIRPDEPFYVLAFRSPLPNEKTMNSRRIAKMCGALIGGQGVNLLTQFLLPPLFLRSYGIAMYGEWLTLSAAVSYLGTLNFGLQTFVNNQAGIASSRGDTTEVNTLQATALLLLLLILMIAAAVTGSVFLLPVASWLNLQLSNRDAALITYLLGLQVLARMLYGFFSGSFLVVGLAHRGQNWNNALALIGLAVTAGAVAFHSGLVRIAVLQLVVIPIFGIATVIDLRRLAPEVAPRLRFAQRSRFGQILKPSGYFAMLFSSNFLVYQLPVLLMNRLLGPASVVVFSLTRTIYSMSRQLLSALSQAIGPEIVELYGTRSWDRLHRLYDLSERAVFALTPVVSLGTFAVTPLLIGVWLHKPELYNAHTCFYMALISAVMGIKEHKYIFQTSANQHSAMARFVFASYAAMVIVSIPGIRLYRLSGFLILWLCTEIAQLLYILRLNQRLFAQAVRLDMKPVYRLSGLLIAAFAVCFTISPMFSKWSDMGSIALTITAILTVAAASYYLFDLKELQSSLASRIFRRA